MCLLRLSKRSSILAAHMFTSRGSLTYVVIRITQPGGYSGIPPPFLERNDKELLKHPHNLGQNKKMVHVWFTLGFILYFHLLFINGSVSGP